MRCFQTPVACSSMMISYLERSRNNRFWETLAIMVLVIPGAGRILKYVKWILNKAVLTLTQTCSCRVGLTGFCFLILLLSLSLAGIYLSMGRSSGNPILGEHLMFTPNSGSSNSSTGKMSCVGLSAALISGMPRAPARIEISLCCSSMKGGNSPFLQCSQSIELKCCRVFSVPFSTNPFALPECVVL